MHSRISSTWSHRSREAYQARTSSGTHADIHRAAPASLMSGFAAFLSDSEDESLHGEAELAETPWWDDAGLPPPEWPAVTSLCSWESCRSLGRCRIGSWRKQSILQHSSRLRDWRSPSAMTVARCLTCCPCRSRPTPRTAGSCGPPSHGSRGGAGGGLGLARGGGHPAAHHAAGAGHARRHGRGGAAPLAVGRSRTCAEGAAAAAA